MRKMDIIKKKCNCCGGREWGDMGKRRGIRCLSCGSLERTRVIKLFLDKYSYPRPGIRVLHFAPERGIHRILTSITDVEYEGVDLSPENFSFTAVKRIDLCKDAQKLKSNYYDLIINSHIMEHVPCNVTAVLFHIHRALRPGGLHLMCVPFMKGFYSEDLSPLDGEETIKSFGQADHVRKFGKLDYQNTIGMIFNIPKNYALNDYFNPEELDIYNIPQSERKGLTGTSVFPFCKEDLLLTTEATVNY